MYKTHHPFLSFFSIVFGIVVLCSCIKNSDLGLNAEPQGSNKAYLIPTSGTPTPFPLPTLVYQQPSRITTILNQLFNHQEPPDFEIRQKGQKVAESTHFLFFAKDNYLPVDPIEWQTDAEGIYNYVQTRMGIALEQKPILAFGIPKNGECPTRGLSVFDQQPVILIYADQSTPQEQIQATLAHELGHVFISEGFEGKGDSALNEGLATWAAGNYWTAWKGATFDESVKSYLQKGTYLPLYQNSDLTQAKNRKGDCLVYRDTILTEWASFEGYLIRTGGMEKLQRLFKVPPVVNQNSQILIQPPNYKDAFGFELNQLEVGWLSELSQ
jgi:hypothetical protein